MLCAYHHVWSCENEAPRSPGGPESNTAHSTGAGLLLFGETVTEIHFATTFAVHFHQSIKDLVTQGMCINAQPPLNFAGDCVGDKRYF